MKTKIQCVRCEKTTEIYCEKTEYKRDTHSEIRYIFAIPVDWRKTDAGLICENCHVKYKDMMRNFLGNKTLKEFKKK